ncbi:MAG TPA: C-type lectin domain-containing protein [Polyangiaceae bacterium]|nr:C-type lectin domain-containing protein [Polyangiaceae bacterium]
MRSAANGWTGALTALFVGAAFSACSYDFDALVAHTGPGGAGGSAGLGGAGGAASDDASDGPTGAGGSGGATDGAAGRGGSGATEAGADAGKGGTAVTDAGGGKSGADAASDRGATASDVRADAAFDCASAGGTVYQGHCYYPSATMTTWDVANTSGCVAPSHLVVITTAGEQGIVAAILPGKDRWIGLHKDLPANLESSFHWVTGEALTHKSWDSYDTGPPEPNYSGDCVRMRLTNNWGDTPCTDSYVAVCERE